MTPKKLQRVIEIEPRRSFRLRLEDGEEVTVPDARKALVSGHYVACAGTSNHVDPLKPQHRLRIIRVADVLAVEYLQTAQAS